MVAILKILHQNPSDTKLSIKFDRKSDFPETKMDTENKSSMIAANISIHSDIYGGLLIHLTVSRKISKKYPQIQKIPQKIQTPNPENIQKKIPKRKSHGVGGFPP